MASEDRILHLLKTRGPQRAATLAKALGISASAVRQQLGDLMDSGLVDHEDRREGPGRPKRHWWLTDAGHAGFPDTHSQLTTELLRSVRVVFGEVGLDQLIGERERSSEALYARELVGSADVGERVKRLARLRADEGYMAECRQQDDGSWLLIENHCPICAAARECEGFCRSELEIFRRVLGANVERTDHVLAGARRCAYRVSGAA
jgi:predicted ArsR family transcriptional regulator